MPGPLTREVASGQIFKYTFQTVDMPDAAGTANVLGGAVGTEYPMPLAGSIVGIAARGNAALGAGPTVTFRPTVNGSAVTTFGGTAISSTNRNQIKNKSRDIHKFAAGDRLGVDWVKSGTVSPTTIDYVIDVYVLMGDFEV